jgi:fructose-bisphosphate aldolase class 1
MSKDLGTIGRRSSPTVRTFSRPTRASPLWIPWGIPFTEQSRRAYREMLFTTPGAAEFISGAILYDETIRQKSSGGTPLAEVLLSHSIVPGIKVDAGAEPR